MKVKELIKHLEEYPNKDADVSVMIIMALEKSNKVIPTMTTVKNILVPVDNNDTSHIVLSTETIKENI
jgi:protein subunit release factor A